MGQLLRQYSEAARQKFTVFSDRNFVPTSNERNMAMFKDATAFCLHIKKMDRDLKALSKASDGYLNDMRVILSSAQPSIYDEVDGRACPTTEYCSIGGQIDGEILAYAADQKKKRLEAEVIEPMKCWLASYSECEKRMAKLEKLRLELDGRTRMCATLNKKVDLQRTKSQYNRSEKLIDELNRTQDRAQHKQTKLERTRQAYKEFEQQVYNSLFTLINDTKVMKTYLQTSIQIIQDTYNMVYGALTQDHAVCASVAAARTAQPTREHKPKKSGLFKLFGRREKADLPPPSAVAPAHDHDSNCDDQTAHVPTHQAPQYAYHAPEMAAAHNPYAAQFHNVPSQRYTTAAGWRADY